MKLLRETIRRIIMEYRVRPSTGDEETDDKIRDMIDTKDTENVAQADDLASLLGYESDEPFSKSDFEYDHVGLVSKYSKLLDRMGIAMPQMPSGIKLISIDEETYNGITYSRAVFELEDLKLAIVMEFEQLKNNSNQSITSVKVHVFDVTDDGMYDHIDTVGNSDDELHSVEQLDDLIKDVYERHIKPKRMSSVFKALMQ